MTALSEIRRPFVCCTVTDRTVSEARRTIRLGALEGADAFEVHLPLLTDREDHSLEELFESTTRPVYVTGRRAPFYRLLGLEEEEVDAMRRSEDERVDELLDAVSAGADGLDMELDTFDPMPAPEGPAQTLAREDDTSFDLAEFTRDEGAIQRQRQVVEEVHDRGGEAVLSCHPMVHLSPEDAVDIGEAMIDRGADLAKIVGVDRTLYDVLDTLEANLRLAEELAVPFTMMSMGDVSRAVRLTYPMFGSSWVFTQTRQVPDGFEAWPLVENAREVFRRTDWEPAWDAHRRRRGDH